MEIETPGNLLGLYIPTRPAPHPHSTTALGLFPTVPDTQPEPLVLAPRPRHRLLSPVGPQTFSPKMEFEPELTELPSPSHDNALHISLDDDMPNYTTSLSDSSNPGEAFVMVGLIQNEDIEGLWDDVGDRLTLD